MLLPQDGFVVMHGVIIPLMLMATIPSLRKVMLGMVSSQNEEEEEFEMEMEPQGSLTTEHHRPCSAPTRPSSAVMPSLPGAPDMAMRVPYKSNIRKHRSALEAVVSVPRRRKHKIMKTEGACASPGKGGGGPLDGVMLDMVGEKVIPLDESDDEEPSNCKTM